MKSIIEKALTSYENDIIAFLKELIEIPTVNPPGEFYKECTDAITRKLREMGLTYNVIETQVNRQETGLTNQEKSAEPGYCITSCYGHGEKTLYFHGHYDVVPSSNIIQFQPYIKNGKIYGRGSVDMKGGLTAMIYAIKAIKDFGIDLNGRICLNIVPDEETGGKRGSQYLTEKGLLGVKGIGMLMPEMTDGSIKNANRGAISLRVTVKGKPSHVALHYQGVNAFEQILPIVEALIKLKSEVESRKTNFNIKPEAARHSILLIGGKVEGGTNFNLVPGECSFTIDRRTNPEENLATERDRLFNLLDDFKRKGINLDVEVLQEGGSAGSPDDSPLAIALAESVELVTGKKPVFEMSSGLLETRFYANLGVPAYCYGPGSLTVAHGPEEFVEFEEIHKCAAVYALTAIRLLGIRHQ